MSKFCKLNVLVPQPWFPALRPRPNDEITGDVGLTADIRRMFYVPKISNHWNGMWMERCVEKWLSTLPMETVRNSILDAHFGFPEGVGCYRVAKRKKLPLFITVRGLETELMAVPAIKKQMLEAFDYATGIICVSQSLMDMLMQNGVDGSKIRVISNGVDSDIYSPGDRDSSRSELGIAQETKLIVSLGNVQRRKGYDLLIEAISPYQQDRDFSCVILGGVNESGTLASLQSRVEQLGMKDQVRFLGQATPDVVVKWLRAADMFVLPTRREGCCNAVLEALSTGVPVLSTAAGDNSKFVVDGKNGFIVPHEDPQSIYRAIERTWHHPWDPQSISRSVHQYTWDGAAEQVVDYFNERLGLRTQLPKKH